MDVKRVDDGSLIENLLVNRWESPKWIIIQGRRFFLELWSFVDSESLTNKSGTAGWVTSPDLSLPWIIIHLGDSHLLTSKFSIKEPSSTLFTSTSQIFTITLVLFQNFFTQKIVHLTPATASGVDTPNSDSSSRWVALVQILQAVKASFIFVIQLLSSWKSACTKINSEFSCNNDLLPSEK